MTWFLKHLNFKAKMLICLIKKLESMSVIVPHIDIKSKKEYAEITKVIPIKSKLSFLQTFKN